jgi:NRPS condensation-like uncharacterized protein
VRTRSDTSTEPVRWSKRSELQTAGSAAAALGRALLRGGHRSVGPACAEPPSLQSRLEAHSRGPENPQSVVASGSPSIADPVSLFRHLEAIGRFHRDTGFGRIFHPGRLSFRENVPTYSLHIVIRHNHVAAHVDGVSPLALGAEGPSRYSVRRAAAHNVSGMAQDLVRLLRGRQGDHRAQLDCEWLWNPSESAPAWDLLDPETSAWSLQLEARVSGSLDESRLRGALTTILRRRPATHDLLEVIECPDDPSLDLARAQLYGAPVAVTEWPPFRAQLVRHPGGDVLMLNLNHAASDGFGALGVLRSIAQAYAGEGGDPPPDFLAVRDLPVRPASASVPRLLAWYRAGVERLRNLLTRPARLAPDEAGDAPGYGFHLVRLSADDTRRLADVDRPGTTRNLLLAGLHLATDQWNVQHRAPPGRRIGVLVAVDLRPSGWQEENVGNFSVTARVSTSRRHRAGCSSALQAIRAQTTRNKRTRTGIALLAALERSGLLALWAKQSLVVLQPLTHNRLVDTALLAHLSRVEPPSFGADAGDTVEVWFSAPARAPLGLCIGTVTVSGRLHLVFRYPHRLFSADAARRFADCYLTQVRLLGENRS